MKKLRRCLYPSTRTNSSSKSNIEIPGVRTNAAKFCWQSQSESRRTQRCAAYTETSGYRIPTTAGFGFSSGTIGCVLRISFGGCKPWLAAYVLSSNFSSEIFLTFQCLLWLAPWTSVYLWTSEFLRTTLSFTNIRNIIYCTGCFPIEHLLHVF